VATLRFDVRCYEECPFETTLRASKSPFGFSLYSHTWYPAPDGTPNTRTKVAIGEGINIETVPSGMPADWEFVGYPRDADWYYEKHWYAISILTPTCPGTQTVIARYAGGEAVCSITFTVIVPSDIIYFNPENAPWFPPDPPDPPISVGVFAWFDMLFIPLDVCFTDATFREWDDGRIFLFPDLAPWVVLPDYKSPPVSPMEDNASCASEGRGGGDPRRWAYININHLLGQSVTFEDSVMMKFLDCYGEYADLLPVYSEWHLEPVSGSWTIVHGCPTEPMGPFDQPPAW
jgi:hypothetical protein